jgi:hypothetical protein
LFSISAAIAPERRRRFHYADFLHRFRRSAIFFFHYLRHFFTPRCRAIFATPPRPPFLAFALLILRHAISFRLYALPPLSALFRRHAIISPLTPLSYACFTITPPATYCITPILLTPFRCFHYYYYCLSLRCRCYYY